MSERPHRLATFSYKGRHRYSLTVCSDRRRTLFIRADVVQKALSQIAQSAAKRAFAIFAYCFMPDHLHLLAEGQSDEADLIAFAKDTKQRIGYHYPRTDDEPVWQKGYFERVLRDDETTLTVVKYILENPVRKGLVREPRDYPFSGSMIWSWDELLELWNTDAAALEMSARPEGRALRVEPS
jgi:putative transposase